MTTVISQKDENGRIIIIFHPSKIYIYIKKEIYDAVVSEDRRRKMVMMMCRWWPGRLNVKLAVPVPEPNPAACPLPRRRPTDRHRYRRARPRSPNPETEVCSEIQQRAQIHCLRFLVAIFYFRQELQSFVSAWTLQECFCFQS